MPRRPARPRPTPADGPLRWDLDAVPVEAGDLPGVAAVDADGVLVRHRAARHLLGRTWHHAACGRGKGDVVVRPLSEHPPAAETLWCPCQPECLAAGGQARMRELALVGAKAGAAERGLGRLAGYRPGTSGWLARRDTVAEARDAAVGAAGPLTAGAARRWADGLDGRLAAAGDEDPRQVLGDVVVLLEWGCGGRYRTVGSVAREGWRQARANGEGRRYAENRTTEALSGRWTALWDTGADEPPRRGRARTVRYLVTLGNNVRRWERRLAERVDELDAGDDVAVLWAPRWEQLGLPWADDAGGVVLRGVRATWGHGDGTTVLVVPAAAAGLLARATGGEVVGTGGADQAELCARLLVSGVDRATAWDVAGAATE